MFFKFKIIILNLDYYIFNYSFYEKSIILYKFYKSKSKKIVIFKINIIKIFVYAFTKIIENFKNKIIVI